MSHCTVQDALVQGKGRFRCVPLSKLTYENFLNSPVCNGPCNDFVNLTDPCRFGECDAFMSHSWHDNVDLKWAALQEWRTEFVAENGREPRIWFDKCCINQTDIVEDLRGLPIFVSGCTKMLVMCGPTYLNRLWCLVELFTFVHMGGSLDQLTLILLARADQNREKDLQNIMLTIETFDAQECKCFVDADKDKMLAIIHAAFGCITSFNEEVRTIFLQAGVIHDIESSLPAASSIGGDLSNRSVSTMLS